MKQQLVNSVLIFYLLVFIFIYQFIYILIYFYISILIFLYINIYLRKVMRRTLWGICQI